MSYQYGTTCYATPTLANKALAFDKSGQVFNNAETVYVSGVGAVTDTTIEITQYRANGSYVGSTVVASNPPPCALLGTADAVELAWAIGGVWIAAWSIKTLAKIFNSDPENDT